MTTTGKAAPHLEGVEALLLALALLLRVQWVLAVVKLPPLLRVRQHLQLSTGLVVGARGTRSTEGGRGEGSL